MENRQESTLALPKRKRRADDGELDITPMIDITFLLLSFFVVVSKMDPSAQVAMPVAKHGTSVPEKASVIIIVIPSDRDEPNVYLGRSKDESAKASGSIEDIEKQIADYIAAEFADPLKTTVIIKAERKVKYRHLDIVKRAVSREMAEDQIINVGIEEE
jgi:biopolymer transport protein ExbD